MGVKKKKLKQPYKIDKSSLYTQEIAFNLYTSRFNFFSRLAIYGGLRKKIETGFLVKLDSVKRANTTTKSANKHGFHRADVD
jgi:hypothetical protein